MYIFSYGSRICKNDQITKFRINVNGAFKQSWNIGVTVGEGWYNLQLRTHSALKIWAHLNTELNYIHCMYNRTWIWNIINKLYIIMKQLMYNSFSYPVYKRRLCTSLYLVIHTCLRSRMPRAVRCSPSRDISSRCLPPTSPDEDRVSNRMVLEIIVDRANLIVRLVKITQARQNRTYKNTCIRPNRKNLFNQQLKQSMNYCWWVRAAADIVCTNMKQNKGSNSHYIWLALSLKVSCSIVVPGDSCTVIKSLNIFPIRIAQNGQHL